MVVQIVGTFKYETLKALKEDVKKRLIRIGETESMRKTSFKNYLFFLELIKRYDGSDGWIPKYGVVDFRLRLDKYKHKITYVVNNSGNEKLISFIKQINPPTPNSIFSSVLRNIENKRASEFRDKHKFPKLCPHCLKPTRNLEMQVDHIKPFTAIRDEFIKLCDDENILIPSSFDEDKNELHIFKEEDNEFKLFWLDFQPDNNFQYLCRRCNGKKGTKH